MTYTIGNVLDVLPTLAAGRFRCCVTSPPYWGLRDYGHPDQLGLEPTPEAYVARMVDVFREVRRTLTDDGTLWLNVGDSYAGQPGGFQGKNGQRASRTFTARIGHDKRAAGLKAKDLCGIPWRLAFGLQNDGWYLRSDIIWHKPNPMPESIKDRPTKAHEYVFLLSKSPRYFYDHKAASEDATGLGNGNKPTDKHETASRTDPRRRTAANLSKIGPRDKRSSRSVWTISSRPFKGAHFAVMPPPLAERCIRAGSAVGDEVLDPFLGSGTVGMVCEALGRRWFGVELQPDYAPLIEQRTARGPLLARAA